MTPDIIEELKKPLDKRHVKPAPPGKYGEYVDAYHVISEANRIFGHGGWQYALTRVEMTNCAEDDAGKHHIGYLATVRVDIHGVSREDVGHGQGHGRSLGDAHDSAAKEAVTDALKRALRTFGSPFGLALYDKQHENVRDIAEDTRTIQQHIGQIENAGTVADLRAVFEMICHVWGKGSDGKWKVPPQVVAAKDARKAQVDAETRSAAVREAAGPDSHAMYGEPPF